MMLRRYRMRLGVLVVVLAAAIAWWMHPRPAPGPAPAPVAAPAPARSGLPVPGPTPVEPAPSSAPRRRVDPRAQDRQMVGTAGRFLRAFARPPVGTPQQQWWARVRPFLTAQAAADFAGTNPQRVPFTRVTGPGVLVPSSAPADLATIVQIPTNAGPYQVVLSSDPTGVHVVTATAGPAQTS